MPEEPKSLNAELLEALEKGGTEAGRHSLAVDAALSRTLWLAAGNSALERIKKLLEKKLKDTAPEKIVAPESYIAVPAVQALGWSLDCGELCYMYLSLLAAAMNADTRAAVHPAFLEIIRQMSPLDARIFRLLAELPLLPMITITGVNRETGERTALLRHIVPRADFAPFPEVSKSLDNLSRCALIRLHEDAGYPDEADYDAIRNAEGYRQLYYSLAEASGAVCDIEEEPQMVSVTDLGRAFYGVCLK